MKKYNIIITFILILFSFIACEDEDPTAVLNKDIAGSTLQVFTNDEYVLLEENETDTFCVFAWTEVDYGVVTPVTYTLEMDTATNNFADAKEFYTIINEFTDTVTVKTFNSAFLNYGFKPEISTSIEIRVSASIGTSYEPVYSNVLSFTITAYNAYDPIYMIGTAVSDWNTDLAVEVTGVAANKYETTTQFTNGGHFRFFKEPSWDADQWGYDYFTGEVSELLADETTHSDPNYRFDGETGNYKITVDLDAKSIAMALVE
ncbi:MAG TPA: hypothetical protein DCG75_08980 [Bacteroidales bacterium]|nr:hypothetical protein [Bacteroidales bacterium]